jgi:hypothetical protein
MLGDGLERLCLAEVRITEIDIAGFSFGTVK